MERFTFKDQRKFNGRLNAGKVVHLIEVETRVDNEDQSEMTIAMTSCGTVSPTYRGSSFSVAEKLEVTCKKCLKRMK